jgi:hypothetical protein
VKYRDPQYSVWLRLAVSVGPFRTSSNGLLKYVTSACWYTNWVSPQSPWTRETNGVTKGAPE